MESYGWGFALFERSYPPRLALAPYDYACYQLERGLRGNYVRGYVSFMHEHQEASVVGMFPGGAVVWQARDHLLAERATVMDESHRVPGTMPVELGWVTGM